MQRIKNYFALLPVIAAVSLSSALHADPINVDVNNQPITFSNTAPVQQKGAVLVPLRGVFEALGATVSYDPTSKIVSAQKGDTSISLTVGRLSATVNGQMRTLDQPAEVIDGSTLVPIRFVAESFGAYVQWNPSNLTVEIQTQEAHLSTLPPAGVQSSAALGGSKVVGQLTGIYTNTTPQQITLRINGQNTSVPITPSTVVMISKSDQPTQQEDVHSLTVGDQLHVSLTSNGSAAVIEATYGEIVGTIKSIQANSDGSSVVNLNDGTVVEMTKDASLTMAGRHILYKDIEPSDQVKIQTDQGNKIGYSLDVVTSDMTDNSDTTTLPVQDTDNARVIPAVSLTSPADGAEVSTTVPVIYAVMNDLPGGQVNQKSMRLLVDGKDVTSSATITSQFVTYQPTGPLASGRHKVALEACDATGECTVKSWSFTSPAPHSPLTFTSDKVGKQIVLKPGDTLELTLSAQPRGSAFATVGNLKIPLNEDKPGVYVGELKAASNMSLPSAPVIAHFSAADHTCLTANLSQMVAVAGDPPVSPKIQSPAEGAQIGNAVEIAGVSAPGSIVNVTIAYATKMLGLVPITGTSASTQVIADTSGNWKTDEIALSKPSLLASDHSTGLTITATSVDATGQHSPPASVKVLLQ